MKTFITNNLREPEAGGPMTKCPRYAVCSAPVCPLDPDQDKRTRLQGEPKCPLSKRLRIRLAEGADLERDGMTKSEWARHRQWSEMTESERARRTAKLRPFGKFSHENRHDNANGQLADRPEQNCE